MDEQRAAWAREAYHVAMHEIGDSLMALVAAAQAVVETGWGAHVPEGSNNWLGIHATGDHPFVVAREGGTGAAIRYRKYDSPGACFRSWLYLAEKSVYYEEPRAWLQEALKGVREAERETTHHAYREWGKRFVRIFCPGNPNYPVTVTTVAHQIERLIEGLPS